MGDPFLALGPIEGHKVQHSLVTWGQIEKIFWISSLTPNVKPMGLISTLKSLILAWNTKELCKALVDTPIRVLITQNKLKMRKILG
jgi:hypothetical protein